MHGSRCAIVVVLACVACKAPDPPPGPRRLSRAGLYADIAKKKVSSDAVEFEPRYALWSDGAEKRRWIRLPQGGHIDKSDPDHWQFPVGTQLFKEFSRDGRRLETRLIEHVADTGDREVDYWVGAFIWNEDESDAVFAEDGEENVSGTTHDVPAAKDCWRCHVGEPGRVLGYSAMQLERVVPGNDVERDALGYLHANCGHCHWHGGSAWREADLTLRLSVNEASVPETLLYRSVRNVPLFITPPSGVRVAPGHPETSGIIERMSLRDGKNQMPPLASEVTDDEGIARVAAWISALP